MRIFCLGSLLLTLLCSPLAAQTATTTTVSGVVTDEQGAAIANTAVKLTEVATGIERATKTDSAGRYNFYAVSPGLFKVAVSAPGFKTKVVSDVQAEVSKVANVNVTMEVGSITEVIQVAANVEAELQKSDASIGGVLNEERLKRLPNFSRSAISFFTLQPATSPRGQYAGSRSDQSTVSLDGVDVTDHITGGTGTFPIPVESVEELRATVVNANATFGHSAGGQFVLITKSGSNQFHGSAYLYHQDSALTANSWTNNRLGIKRPFLLDNRFGFTFGGPIKKERTFFFINYEGRRNPASATVSRIVPTESFRAGLLRFRDSGGVIQTINPRTFDPRGIGSNPKILEYLSLYPAANDFTQGDGLNTAGFTFAAPVTTTQNFGLARLDHKFTDKWNATAKFTADRLVSVNPGQVDLLKKPSASNSTFRPRNAVATVIGLLSPHLTNEVRFSWLHDRQDFNTETPPPLVGLNAAINLGSNSLDDLVDVDTQRARRQFGHTTTYQWSDTLTWIKGAHNIQAGGNIQHIRSIIFRNDKVIGSLADPVADVSTAGGFVAIPAAQRPNFIQPADVSRYNNLYASLLGIVSQVPALITRDGDLNLEPLGTGLLTKSTLRTWEFFVSDTWRWKPSLTLTYGLTYGWQEPPVEDAGKQTILSFKDTGEPVDFKKYIKDKRAAAEAGQVYNPDLAYVPIRKSGRSKIFDTDYTNVSPRLSLAWNPSFKDGLPGLVFGDRKTVIRGGYSLVFDRTNTVQSIQLPTLGVGFAQTINLQGPKNAAGQPFRVGIDGPIPLPTAPAVVPSPVVPSKPFGETLSFSVDPHIRVPRNHVFDLTIQRELPWKLLLEVGYVGRLARDLYVAGNLNSVPFMFKDTKSGQTFAQAFDAVAVQLRNKRAVSAQPYFENLYGPGTTAALVNSNAGDFIVGNVSTIQQIALDRNTAFTRGKGPVLTNLQSQDLTMRFSGGSSNYHALIVSLHKRYSRGLTFDLNYTLSRYLDQVYIDTQNQIDQVQTSYFLDTDYGASDFDFRHIFNANGTFDLPLGKGHRLSFNNSALNKIAGGWFMAGIFTARSGTAQSVQQNNQAFGGGSVFGPFASAIPNTKPNASAGVHSIVKGSNGVGVTGDPARGGTGLNLFANPEEVFNNFRPALLSQDGRTGRGVLRGLPQWNLDWTLGKQTAITERVRFTLNFDFANIFNHVIFADPFLNLQNPFNFGVINRQANGPRRIQVGGRIDF